MASFLSDLSILNPSPNFSVQVTEGSPLSKLYAKKYDLASYYYPRDLASNPAKKHVIRFTTLVPSETENINPQDFSNVGSGISKTLSSLLKADTDALTSNALDLSRDAGQLASKFTDTQLRRRPDKSIALYIPDTVNVQYGANYSDVSLTDTLGKPYFYAQAGGSTFDYIKNFKDMSASQLLSKASNDPFLRAVIGSKLPLVGSDTLGQIAVNAIGQAFNPQLQVLFTSIGFRSFQFDFTLTPYSAAEAKQIRDIVEAFKYAAAPEIVPGGIFTQSIFQKVPDQFMIEFIYDGVPNDNIHKIGICVLTNINVDYAPMGWATFGDGNPVQTKLTLQFQETEIIDKNKIKQGY